MTEMKQLQTELLNEAKFLKRGTKINVEPTPPTETTVEGKFGKRKMYIINTKEYGMVYVSNLQMLHILNVFNGDYSNAVTVEL